MNNYGDTGCNALDSEYPYPMPYSYCDKWEDDGQSSEERLK